MTNKSDEIIVLDASNAPNYLLKKDQQNDGLLTFNANKPVYLVLVEDHSTKDKKRAFLSQSISPETTHFKFTGYEIQYSNNNNKIKTHSDAAKLALNKDDIFDIIYPWHKIISVRNVTYVKK